VTTRASAEHYMVFIMKATQGHAIDVVRIAPESAEFRDKIRATFARVKAEMGQGAMMPRTVYRGKEGGQRRDRE
jgi:hypothetical protein